MIPHTFHSIWVGDPMPDHLAAYVASWVDVNPGWTHRIWGEADLDWLTNQSLFDEAEKHTTSVGQFRSDIARYEILHRFGGVYVDCDFEALAPIAGLIADADCFAAWETDGTWINNAIMGATPGHPLLLELIAKLPDNVRRNRGKRPNILTGPQLLTPLMRSREDVTIFPSSMFFPYRWDELGTGTTSRSPTPTQCTTGPTPALAPVSDVVTIEAFDRSYRIVNPGPGRVGSKLAQGTPYERRLLVDCYQQGLSGTAFDVGAHIGNHTLYFAAICGFTVHAWEPFDESRAALEANLALNPDLDVTVHDWAAGATDGRGRLTDMAIKLDRGDVPVHAIDDHLDVSDLAVIKIDVEGMEAEVVAGALSHIIRCRPVIYSETHTPQSHASVAALLEPLDYCMTRAIHMGSTMERWSP